LIRLFVMMGTFSPSQLPEVTAVEVVDLRGISANQVSEFMQRADGAPRVRCEDRRVNLIAEAWRSLPEGESIRCHTPPIGIRFYQQHELVAEASICWRCQNMYGQFRGQEFGYSFSAESTAARALFELTAGIIGAEVLQGE
jgi:hypothetical protein